MHALRELQREFAAALRDRPNAAAQWVAGDGLTADARLRVYRNNSAAMFEQALALTYPVLRRRVGEGYFAQLAREYRAAHPSRAGDLHEVGREFAAFLATHLAGGDYVWLADVAALEWACADASAAANATPIELAALGEIAPEAVPSVRFDFVPSLRCVTGDVPILQLWRANQPDAPGDPTDLTAGAEHVIVHRPPDGLVELRGVPADEFEFVRALADGATLEAALEASALALDALPGALHRLFTAGAVAALHAPSGE